MFFTEDLFSDDFGPMLLAHVYWVLAFHAASHRLSAFREGNSTSVTICLGKRIRQTRATLLALGCIKSITLTAIVALDFFRHGSPSYAQRLYCDLESAVKSLLCAYFVKINIIWKKTNVRLWCFIPWLRRKRMPLIRGSRGG
jgi:hypothetical protein